MRCYSKWIEFAYPNRIDRSNLFKRLNATAKISSANLLLAQILDSGKFATTTQRKFKLCMSMGRIDFTIVQT